MSKCSNALASLLAFYLVFPIPYAPAQTAPGDTETATGDVWMFRGERNYLPQEVLQSPKTISPSDIEFAIGDVWLSQKKRIDVPQEALVPEPVDVPQTATR
jgi:hypothetical protein